MNRLDTFKKYLPLILLIMIIIGGGVHVHKSKNIKKVDADDLHKIVVAQAFEVFLYAPLYVAEEKGFFNNENLKVEIITAGGDEKAFAALISGDAQIAIGDPTFAAVAGEKGRPGKVIAGILSGVPFWGVSNEPLEFNSHKDLAGLTVATFPAPSTAYTIQSKMFKDVGLEPKIAEVAFGSLLAALNSDRVDVALELEPNVSQALSQGKHIAYNMSDYYGEFVVTGATALPSFVDNNPEIVGSFKKAINASMEFIHTHPEEAVEVLVDRFPSVPYEIALDAVRRMASSGVFPTNTCISQKAWSEAVGVRQEIGDLENNPLFVDYINNVGCDE